MLLIETVAERLRLSAHAAELLFKLKLLLLYVLQTHLLNNVLVSISMITEAARVITATATIRS
jgi:hypothetical protein